MPQAENSIWVDNQVPNKDQVFVDHAGWFVEDLAEATAALHRLGFAPSGVNLQTNLCQDGITRPSGTSNVLVRLHRGFLEFLAATHDTPLADQLRTSLARYQGMHLIAFSQADLDALRERLTTAGFAMQPLVHLRRHAQDPGVDGEVAWTVLRAEPGVMPEGRIQFVFPHTPELSWPPGSMDHPNRATALTAIVLCSGESQEALSRYAAYIGRPANGDRIVTDRGTLRIVDPNAATEIVPEWSAPPSLPFMAAVSVATADLDETRRVLTANGVSVTSDDRGRLWVAPADALGCHLCFHRPAAPSI